VLKQRIFTSLVLIAILLGALFIAPPIGFQILVALIIAVAAWECSNFAELETLLLRCAYVGIVVAGVLGVWHYLSSIDELRSFFVAAAIWWAIALLWIQGYPSSQVFWQSRYVRALMGALILVPAGVSILTIHQMTNGRWFVLGLLLIVATADTGAYFSGKAFGKHKLAPKVSPGKTWEGVFGGLLMVAAAALIFGLTTDHAWFTGLVVAVPTAAVSVVGDLIESMLKRHRGIKDSGLILPGHGGIMDRIDGITAAAPIFALGLIIVGWI
jgi:phosphatidate cytidylyltransferase